MSQYAEQTLEILRSAQAVLSDDHFVYISGDHGSGWIDKDAIFPHTDVVEHLCSQLAQLVQSWDAEVVCGPATGGLIIAEWTAHALKVIAAFAEHGEANPIDGTFRGRFRLRRGYDHLVSGKRVLVVDDVVNTGHSLRQTAQAVTDAGGQVIGTGCLVSRGNVTQDELGLGQFAYLLEYQIPAWPEAACPLCRAGVPINTRYAHGGDFLARQVGKDTSG